MQAKLLVVQVCEFSDGGQAVYRYHAPSRALGQRPGIVIIDCDPTHHLLPELLDLAHVVVFQGHDTDYLPVIHRRRAAGRATVYELNDDVTDFQPFNDFGSPWGDRTVVADLRQFLATVDGIQATTAALIERVGVGDRPAAVFANLLPDVPPLSPKPARPLTLGWGGSDTHLADWRYLAPTLQRWLNAHPDVHLAVMGTDLARSFIQLPADRYHAIVPGSLANYLEFLKTVDIGLAPLLPTGFNLGRSDVKYLEYAAHGVPGIYANVGPYAQSVTHDRTGLLYANDQEFVAHLDRLATSAAERERIAQSAWEEVSRNRRLEPHVGPRLDFYRALLTRPAEPVSLPPHVLPCATADGHYLQLRKGEPEQRLIAALSAPDLAGRVAQLRSVTTALPGYGLAQSLLGQTLNEAGDYRAALGPLTAAQTALPLSTRVQCEMARTRFGLGDRTTARQQLDAAVALNERSASAWRYLLQLAGATGSPGAAELADRATRLHPDDYRLSLLAALLLPSARCYERLTQIVNDLAPTVLPHERATILPAISGTLAAAVARHGGPGAIDLLRTACNAFPDSARLHALLADTLWQAGHTREAEAHYQQAAKLRTGSQVYQSEFPTATESNRIWQTHEYTARWHAS